MQLHRSRDQAGLHDLLEPDPVEFKMFVGHSGGQIQELAKPQGHGRKRFRQHEAIPAVKIPGAVGLRVDWDDDRPGGSGQADHPCLDDSGRPPGTVHDVSGKTRTFQVTDHLFEGLASAS